jgi:Acetyltransferase (GNAT) domain
VPQRVAIGQRILRGFMVQDVMTHPEYRGRGFLHRLGQQCLDEILAAGDVGYTFPNKLSEGSFRRLGWTDNGLVPRRGAVVSAERPPTPVRATVEPLEGPFDARTTAIWEGSGLATGVCRDARFLEWRYGKPGIRYERFRVNGDAGFLVLKTFDDGSTRIVHLCDVVLRAEARSLLPSVLGFTFHFAHERGARRLTAWLPADHPYAPDFDAAGLAIEEHDRIMFVAGPAAGPERHVWHVTQGDSDVY